MSHDFPIGSIVRVIAKVGDPNSEKTGPDYNLTYTDIQAGIKTGDIGVVTTHPIPFLNHPIPFLNDETFVYVNLSEEHPFWAFFSGQLELVDKKDMN